MKGEKNPEYAIAGHHGEFRAWQREDPENRRQVFYLSGPWDVKGRPPGKVHRIGTWHTRNSELLDYVRLLEV